MDAGPLYKKPALLADRAGAETAIEALLAAGLVDPTRRIVSGERVLIPLRVHPDLPAWAARLGGVLVDDADMPPREGRVTPREQVARRVSAPARSHVPDRWEIHGDVLVLRVEGAARPFIGEIAAAFAEVLGAKCVVEDTVGVGGELREMAGALLWGDDPVGIHLENGVRFRFDASRIMFSSGNLAERMRLAKLDLAGETLVDMFAGIGYFTLPIAVHARPVKVFAIEKNPVSYRYLVENIGLNAVADVVEPWHGDNRDFPREGIADRVLMGYFPGTEAFLPKAFRLLGREGGTIHFHNTAHARTWRETMTQQLLEAARSCETVVAVEGARIVKTHSPGVVHAVIDLRVRRP